MFKEIFPILICLSHHKNNEIAQKIYELNCIIKKNIIADVFELNTNHDLKSEKYTIKMLLDDERDSEEKNSDNNNVKEKKYSNNAFNKNRINNKSSVNNNSNIKHPNTTRKLSESDKQSLNNNHNNSIEFESEDKKFDLKIEALKKLILDEIQENKQNSEAAKPQSLKAANISSACAQAAMKLNNTNNLLRNVSTAKAKENAEKDDKEAVNNFKNYALNRKNEKIKLNKNACNANNNNSNGNSICTNRINNTFNSNNNNNNNRNRNNENTRSGFFNSIEESKIDYFINKENIYNYESCVIDNTNMLTTETYNIDSSILSVKENNLNCMNSAYQNTRLRKNSSFDYKEKIRKEKMKRICSTDRKGIFLIFDLLLK